MAGIQLWVEGIHGGRLLLTRACGYSGSQSTYASAEEYRPLGRVCAGRGDSELGNRRLSRRYYNLLKYNAGQFFAQKGGSVAIRRRQAPWMQRMLVIMI